MQLWLDPVCPFSWNTARWLAGVAEEARLDVEWHLMSLAELNEGREQMPAMQLLMNNSRRVGRLMAAIHAELGTPGLVKAYFAFGEQYFDHGAAVDEDLIAHVIRAAGACPIAASLLPECDLDFVVRQSHQESQHALGEPGGSPMLTIDGHTFFGPVLAAVPKRDSARTLFDAVAALAATPQFSQLQRPLTHG
ncbi:mycothiol-dependent nitroreductase Rv2466c family protein [Mycobacteroides abscessus]|uniref:mycothiol-dependent nitroreductase Rv2466c family protein n=1 Tax=Mycobacteroides abscessus TaxID=36809 RepID=UPI000C264774|nr:hypothetical protein [Mycobacteroides abscessus]